MEPINQLLKSNINVLLFTIVAMGSSISTSMMDNSECEMGSSMMSTTTRT